MGIFGLESRSDRALRTREAELEERHERIRNLEAELAHFSARESALQRANHRLSAQRESALGLLRETVEHVERFNLTSFGQVLRGIAHALGCELTPGAVEPPTTRVALIAAMIAQLETDEYGELIDLLEARDG